MGRVRKKYDVKGLDKLIANVAYKLRTIRQQKEMTQTELARRSKVAQSTITEIENGLPGDLQLLTICQLANGLDVDVYELLTRSDVKLADPDKREFAKAVDDLERGFRTVQRLQQRLK